MAIFYTKHAEEMSSHRSITKRQVKQCIQNPDKITPEKEGTKAYLKNFGKDYLRLIVSEQQDNFIIVTLHWVAKTRVRE